MDNWQSQYEALTTNSAVVSLRNWSQVRLTGGDRAKFLHNMCTNDIRRLEVGQTCEAFCTDVKGKIIDYVQVIATADHLTLLTLPGHAEWIITHLDRYIIREDVQLTDVSSRIAWYYVVGPRASARIPTDQFTVKCAVLWPGGFLMRRDAEKELETSPIEFQSTAFTALRVESGWPVYGVDFSEDHLPQEIDRDQRAISFTKGCYLGQETVARIDALGHVNKKLVLVKFSGETVPTSGDKLSSSGQEVGVITTSCWSPQFSAPLALGFVRRGVNELGTQLQWGNDTAEVVAPIETRVV
jgi:tRNA-modifying protein YgfZ